METQTNNQLESVKNTLEDILARLGLLCEVELQESGDGAWFVIKTDDAPLLIGEGGQNLAALNHIVKRIAEVRFAAAGNEPPRFSLDVNGYHKKKIEEIKDLARMHAQRVRYFKKEVEMRPMNAYDRRIVHSILQELPDISTESRGEGLERRVVIKPLELV